MDISSRKVCKAILMIGLLVLVSCSPARFEPEGTATEAVSISPTPTSRPYWDLLPLPSDPAGGWTAIRMEDSGISFQYPSVYQEGNCGTIFTEDKMGADYQSRLIGFEGSSIRIHVFDEWGSELDQIAGGDQPPSEGELVTSVEPFSLGGMPAVRYISMIPNNVALEYTKVALAYHGDRLYMFSFGNVTYLPSCDAPPLSEEQVYEHLLSTLDFLD